jgi:hypothetical protein
MARDDVMTLGDSRRGVVFGGTFPRMFDYEEREHAKADDRVFRAFYAALLAGSVWLLLSLFASHAGPADDPRAWIVPSDALLTLLLAWLMKRHRSEPAAGLLLIRSLVFGIISLRTNSILGGLVSLCVFAPLYLFGFVGVRTLRRLELRNGTHTR